MIFLQKANRKNWSYTGQPTILSSTNKPLATSNEVKQNTNSSVGINLPPTTCQNPDVTLRNDGFYVLKDSGQDQPEGCDGLDNFDETTMKVDSKKLCQTNQFFLQMLCPLQHSKIKPSNLDDDPCSSLTKLAIGGLNLVKGTFTKK